MNIKVRECTPKAESLDDGAEEMIKDLQAIINKYCRGGSKVRLEMAKDEYGQDFVDGYYGDDAEPTFHLNISGTSNAYVLRDVVLKVIEKYY